jgi:hypothetical protein
LNRSAIAGLVARMQAKAGGAWAGHSPSRSLGLIDSDQRRTYPAQARNVHRHEVSHAGASLARAD